MFYLISSKNQVFTLAYDLVEASSLSRRKHILNNRIVSSDLSLLNTNKHTSSSFLKKSLFLKPILIFNFSLNYFFTLHLLFHLKNINTKTCFSQNTEKLASHLSLQRRPVNPKLHGNSLISSN